MPASNEGRTNPMFVRVRPETDAMVKQAAADAEVSQAKLIDELLFDELYRRGYRVTGYAEELAGQTALDI